MVTKVRVDIANKTVVVVRGYDARTYEDVSQPSLDRVKAAIMRLPGTRWMQGGRREWCRHVSP